MQELATVIATLKLETLATLLLWTPHYVSAVDDGIVRVTVDGGG
jgi:hypothetical protein